MRWRTGTPRALACVGFFSTAGLAVLLYRSRQDGIRLVPFIPLAIPLILYALQLANGIAIALSPDSLSGIDNQAVLSIVFFVFAIARAWRLVGVPDSDFMHALARTALRAARSPGQHGPGAQGAADQPGLPGHLDHRVPVTVAHPVVRCVLASVGGHQDRAGGDRAA
jgi:hypothetical protein